MKYTVVKGTGIHRASVEQPDGTRKAIALFGKVSDLAAQSIIFLDGKPASEKDCAFRRSRGKQSGAS